MVTRSGGLPDLHNVKPPLMIWLMSASIRWLGLNEFAVRLPAALAASATVALVYAFVRSLSRSRATGVAASLILLASAGYVGPHVASTGDYDALLVLFTTAAVAAFFYYVEAVAAEAPDRRVAGRRRSLLAVIGGVLTKWRRRGDHGAGLPDLRPGGAAPRPACWDGGRPGSPLAAIVLATLAFCGLREAAAPGYLNAVLYSDFIGRASVQLDGVGGSPTFYLESPAEGLAAVAAPRRLVDARACRLGHALDPDRAGRGPVRLAVVEARLPQRRPAA